MVSPIQTDVDALAKRHQESRLYGRARFFTFCNIMCSTGIVGFSAFGFNKSAMASAVVLAVSAGLSMTFHRRARSVAQSPICTSTRDILQAKQQLTGPQ